MSGTSPPGLTDIHHLVITVAGRPAPQGSKHLGEHGQMREQSAYLPAWRAAVKKAAYERYRDLGVDPAALPLLRGPVGLHIVFRLPAGRRIDAAPDGDKLDRATWDALTQARVWEDDGRVVAWGGAKVEAAEDAPMGARIEVWAFEEGMGKRHG